MKIVPSLRQVDREAKGSVTNQGSGCTSLDHKRAFTLNQKRSLRDLKSYTLEKRTNPSNWRLMKTNSLVDRNRGKLEIFVLGS